MDPNHDPVVVAQERLDHSSHAILPQLVGELVEMHRAFRDELLSGCQHVVFGDRALALLLVRKQVRSHSALTSHGWPRVCVHTR